MYADSALSLVVPLCVIALVFITRKVIFSLFAGIVLASLMLNDSLIKIMQYLFETIAEYFIVREKCNPMLYMYLDF